MNTAELQFKLIYSMVVAGKSAKFAEGVMSRLCPHGLMALPFNWFRQVVDKGHTIESLLRDSRSGNYGKLTKGIIELIAAKIDLAKCTPEQLETIHGIGPKTSRFFILWTRKGAVHAALDTHVLKWLRFIGHDAPKSTPSGKEYVRLEKIVILEAKRRKMTPRELDAAIWDYCSKTENRFALAQGLWPDNLQKYA